MGLLKFTFLKQFATKSSLKHLKQSYIQQPKKPYINLPFIFTVTTRSYTQCSPQNDISLHLKNVQLVTKSPKSSVVPFIELYMKGHVVKHTELQKIAHALRKKKHFVRALEVSEWMTNGALGQPISEDLAVRLDLMGQVHGIGAAERFFKETNNHSARMYAALLNCYVKANLVDKSLALFNVMKHKGLVTSGLAYNAIMSLYLKVGQVDKVPNLLAEMVESGVSPGREGLITCLKSLALNSDTTRIEKLLNGVKSHRCLSMDWSTCCFVSNYYIDKGCKEKAIYYLQMAETKIRQNPVGIKYLITTYAKLGDTTQVTRLWQKHKAACKGQVNIDYMTMISSLIKMNELEEAERIFQEWESSGNPYDFRVPHILLLGYTRKGLVEKAEKILDGIIDNGRMPEPNTWSIISCGHINCGNMNKAVECMMQALALGQEHQGWVPKDEAIFSLLKWFRDVQIGELDRFLELLNSAVPMKKEMYQLYLDGTKS